MYGIMNDTFAELYAPMLKDVFTTRAQKDLAEGADGLACARAYAEQGKPEFVLAYLLLVDELEEVKRELLAYSYERRAVLSEDKAEELDKKFHRPFPLIKLEAQKDRLAARQVRQGKRVRTGTTKRPTA
jgi:TfoX/Sxy family transcriptional regulator of competence genes